MNRPDAEPTPSSPSSSPAEQTSSTRSPAPPAPRLARVLVGSAALLIVLAIGLALGPSVHDWLDARAAASRDDSASSASDGADGSTWYISQMHPWIIQPEPGQCPICGMDLTPIDPARFAGEITIDPVVVQNIGVRITEADRGPIVTGLRAAGTVALAEERVHDVVPRFGGWSTR